MLSPACTNFICQYLFQAFSLHAEFQRRVLNGMSVMRSQQTEIMDMISTLLRARESFVVEPSQPILVDPLDTPEAIEVFDGALTDATSEALVSNCCYQCLPIL
ncbi:uncharacterized protein ISCGN_032145 [Ixodes scapularis]